MIFDTDVLIWSLRGNHKAARAMDSHDDRCLSLVSYMELLQGARDKQEVRTIKNFLSSVHFRLLPISENIGHRASIYMEEYSLSAGVSMGDALIAATAIECDQPLLTGNDKHYKPIKELTLHRFRP